MAIGATFPCHLVGSETPGNEGALDISESPPPPFINLCPERSGGAQGREWRPERRLPSLSTPSRDCPRPSWPQDALCLCSLPFPPPPDTLWRGQSPLPSSQHESPGRPAGHTPHPSSSFLPGSQTRSLFTAEHSFPFPSLFPQQMCAVTIAGEQREKFRNLSSKDIQIS